MKKIMIIAIFLGTFAIGAAKAQSTPAVDARQQAQQARIRDGVVSGEVTRAEATRLRAEQRHIRRAERRAKSDGTVTRRERRRLHHKQNHASRDIRRQKHDAQDRGN
ncbi:MAG: hypothetical protein ACOYXT_18185 [Bacteroidota bacterium]